MLEERFEYWTKKLNVTNRAERLLAEAILHELEIIKAESKQTN